jgi:hypothetical protein
VSHDGDGSERLLAQSEINGNGVPDMDVPLNDGSQTAFPKIEADAPVGAHATPA